MKSFHFKVLFAFAAVILFFNHSYATRATKKVALLIGGGGEEPGKNGPFLYGVIARALPQLKSRGYSIKAVYNGSHPDISAKLSHELYGDNANVSIPSFSKDHLNEALDSIRAQVRNGELRGGDQVLIQISTHGSPMKANEKSHCVALAEPFQECVSLDVLINFRDDLKKAGVKLAILDQSCYSGGSIGLADTNTCVITAVNRFNPAKADSEGNGFFTTFWDQFSAQPSASLEDAFILARQSERPTGPQEIGEISTPAHLRLRSAFNDYFTDVSQDFFVDHTGRFRSCEANGAGEAVDTVREGLRAILASNLENGRAELSEYDSDLDRLSRLIPQYNVTGEKIIGQVKGRDVSAFNCLPFATPNWQNISFLKNHKFRTVCTKSKTLSYIKDKKLLEMTSEINDLDSRVQQRAQKLISIERDIYNQMYQKLRSNLASGLNPCHDFRL